MITAELQISQALRSRLPPSTHFTLAPGDEVRVQKETNEKNVGMGQ